ncbi:VOC family protein [Nitrospirillum sp. BR 11163]|uniref:VOC family protein n=1 Tax=Nitrospirillum sp. BR 11163 TaxID=3104323 RepID=UPI002AFF4A1C|nr:VOC family protein [Nitrospirillum sp. BR 11163]MEA1672997.1 VOC family protein [Nitrospirillum sp. BR 11163]
MTATVTPFLMFNPVDGQAQADRALALYAAAFPDMEVLEMARYGAEGPAVPGNVQKARFRIGTQQVLCIDSPITHAFTFTPSLSLFVTFTDTAALDHAFNTLSEGGGILMPLAAYPFSPRYAWLTDRFGVSWQVSLA